MKKKKVVAVGNCQASAICNLYREFIGNLNDEDVVYLNDNALDQAVLHRLMEEVDLVIIQERDFNHGLTLREFRPGVEVYTFPMVMAGFIWPFSNEPHIWNEPDPPFDEGPYPTQLSDSYLNRLIARGVSPEEALEQYLALDIAKAASLDRMLELYLDRQRERDAITGFTIAPVIEADFRKEPLFISSSHPNAKLFRTVASQLFEKMNIPAAVSASALKSLYRTPFPPDELPIHPGVITHFGLEFVTTDSTYALHHEGRFTFSEYVLRYMRYETNRDLRLALHFAHQEDPHAALSLLEQALERSPASDFGWRTKARLLNHFQRPDDAISACKRSVEVAPLNSDGYLDLARLLLQTGSLPESRDAAYMAVKLTPDNSWAQLTLAEIGYCLEDYPTMLGAARTALDFSLGRSRALLWTSIALSMTDDAVGAECAAMDLIRLEPDVADHRNHLAGLLDRWRRRAEAIAVLEECVARGVANAQTFSLLGNFHLRNGDIREAGRAFSRGTELDPGRGDLAAQAREFGEQASA